MVAPISRVEQERNDLLNAILPIYKVFSHKSTTGSTEVAGHIYPEQLDALEDAINRIKKAQRSA